MDFNNFFKENQNEGHHIDEFKTARSQRE